MCEDDLFVIGSRNRIGRKATVERIRLIIRRLRCKGCKRIHHKLPTLLIPNKASSRDSCLELHKKMLTQKLREFEHDGIVERKVYNVVPPMVEFSLAEYGWKLKDILDA